MIILIAGDTHTGKTLLAQRLLEKYKYPYLSIDHLKMGLIKSGKCSFTAENPDAEITQYVWPIVRGMITTCIENSQNLIVEGCYIPFAWEQDFSAEELQQIKYVCLIFSRKYVETHFEDIVRFENVIEKRLFSDINLKEMLKVNDYNLEQCISRNYNYILIDDAYHIDCV